LLQPLSFRTTGKRYRSALHTIRAHGIAHPGASPLGRDWEFRQARGSGGEHRAHLGHGENHESDSMTCACANGAVTFTFLQAEKRHALRWRDVGHPVEHGTASPGHGLAMRVEI
jgi:hypothetical protein